MTRQKRLTRRVNEKARSVVDADGIHKLSRSDDTMAYRMSSMSKPGSYHDVFLRWEKWPNGGAVGLHGSCAWVEPVTGSQTLCPGNGNSTICWHVAAAIIKAVEGERGKKVAFFADKEKADRYARFGGHPFPVIGRGVWFVVNGGKAKPAKRSVVQDMADLGY